MGFATAAGEGDVSGGRMPVGDDVEIMHGSRSDSSHDCEASESAAGSLPPGAGDLDSGPEAGGEAGPGLQDAIFRRLVAPRARGRGGMLAAVFYSTKHGGSQRRVGQRARQTRGRYVVDQVGRGALGGVRAWAVCSYCVAACPPLVTVAVVTRSRDVQ